MRKMLNKKGVAIIVVLSSLLLMTTIVSQLLTGSMMSHQLALNYQRRVQTYYLAQSALNMSKMLLYYNKKVESMLSEKKLTYSDLGVEALYKQIPIDSGAIRLLMAGATSTLEGTEEGTTIDEGAEDTANDNTSVEDQTQQVMSMIETDKVEEFLDFEGDFYAEISEEETKYSLNAIAKLSTTTTASTSGTQSESSYDLQKKVLLSILLRPDFKEYFENQDQDAEALVHALADFVDSNSSINDFGNIERGSEESLYSDVDYKVKNTAYLTLSEIRLIPGMTDALYAALEPYVTVYNSTGTINICLAPQEIVDAVIIHFSQYSKCTTALDPEKDEEEIAKIRDAALLECPDTTAVTTALNVAIGIQEASTTTSTSTTSTTTTSTAATTATTSSATTTTASGCELKFSDLISSSNNVFRIKANGEINGVVTTLEEVINVSGSKPSSWTILYYQVD